MAERVILHIGPRKTGTTYLQTTLWDNRDRLAAEGFWLPLESAAQHFEATSRGREGWWTTGRHDQLWALLTEQVRSRPGVAVVSTEMLAGPSPRELAPMLADFGDVAVEVVFGVRSLSRSIPAEWQQWVRARSEVSYDAWLAALRDDRSHGFWKTQDPGRLVRRWSRLVPTERISAVIVPTSAHDPAELWTRFAAACGLDPAGFALPTSSVNESLGVVQAELLRRVNTELDPALSTLDYGPRVRRNLTAAALLGAPGARKVVLPNEHLGWVGERSAELRRELVESRIAVHGDLGDLDVPPPARAGDQMVVGDAELVDAAVQAIVALLDRASARDRAVRKWKRAAAGSPDKPAVVALPPDRVGGRDDGADRVVLVEGAKANAKEAEFYVRELNRVSPHEVPVALVDGDEANLKPWARARSWSRRGRWWRRSAPSTPGAGSGCPR
jgi:hypothetical protein